MITVREARAADAPRLLENLQRVASEGRYLATEIVRMTADDYVALLNRPNWHILVAEIGGQVVGELTLIRGALTKTRFACSLGMLVIPEHRGQGVGSALMDQALEWARQQPGLEKLHLSVFSINEPAINLYRKYGFEIECVRPQHYQIDNCYVDEIMMALWLQ